MNTRFKSKQMEHGGIGLDELLQTLISKIEALEKKVEELEKKDKKKGE